MINQKNKYVTCGQMKLLERRADESGLSYYQMMENAGSGAAAVIREKMSESGRGRDVRYTGFVSGYPDSDLPAVAETAAAPSAETGPMSALIFCGKGNNGGDGFVIARLLCEAGYDVTVIMVDGRPRTEDAVTNYELLLDMDVRILDMTENERALLESGGTPDLIADAMYGTGFSGSLKGNGLKAASFIARARKHKTPPLVFAVDIPSGAGGDMTKEEQLDLNCVRADFTVTFHARKPVHMQSFAPDYCGEIIVVDIGIDQDLLWYPGRGSGYE